MTADCDALQTFRTTGHRELFELLTTRPILKDQDAEAIVYALIDIAGSIEKVYQNLIPAVLAAADAPELARDALWDIRAEFRHIDYHIHDAKLTEL